jgi:hypothetical protein
MLESNTKLTSNIRKQLRIAADHRAAQREARLAGDAGNSAGAVGDHDEEVVGSRRAAHGKRSLAPPWAAEKVPPTTRALPELTKVKAQDVEDAAAFQDRAVQGGGRPGSSSMPPDWMWVDESVAAAPTAILGAAAGDDGADGGAADGLSAAVGDDGGDGVAAAGDEHGAAAGDRGVAGDAAGEDGPRGLPAARMVALESRAPKLTTSWPPLETIMGAHGGAAGRDGLGGAGRRVALGCRRR